MFDAQREIVGVVKATRDVNLETAPEPQWYQPIFFGGSQILVRTSADPAAFAATLRHELVRSDPRLIVKNVQPLDAVVADAVFERRLAAQILSVFAVLALTLALLGLYGVLNFSTVQRRREFGVRMALGARRRDVLHIVFRQGLTMAIVGIAIGTLVSSALTRVLQSLLFEITARDLSTSAVVALTLAAAALAACVPPAWKAASVDPAITLRAD
jgi:ABC-type antimicrobial peptide transport system permease subunit